MGLNGMDKAKDRSSIGSVVPHLARDVVITGYLISSCSVKGVTELNSSDDSDTVSLRSGLTRLNHNGTNRIDFL
jgi:hypothetical protein